MSRPDVPGAATDHGADGAAWARPTDNNIYALAFRIAWLHAERETKTRDAPDKRYAVTVR